jgi:hypothetical protein
LTPVRDILAFSGLKLRVFGIGRLAEVSCEVVSFGVECESEAIEKIYIFLLISEADCTP